MLKDWPSTMKRASFRGVPFFVDTDSFSGGRRVAVHEFIDRDDPLIEDLGGKANSVSIAAYVPGNDADTAAIALLAAGNTKGSSTLRLPARPATFATCTSIKTNFSRKRLGFFGIDLEFQLTPRGGFGILPIGLLRAQMSEAASAALTLVVSAFQSNFSHYPTPGAISPAETVLFSFVTELLAIGNEVTLEGDEGTQTGHLIRTLNAELLSGGVGDEFPTTAGNALFSLVDSVADANGLFDKLNDLYDAGRYEQPVALTYTAEQVELVRDDDALNGAKLDRNRNSVAVLQDEQAQIASKMVRQLAILGMVKLASRAEIDNRKEAIKIRATLSAMLSETMTDIETFEDHIEVQKSMHHAIDQLSEFAANLRPIIEIETQVSLPATFMAHQLFNDAEMASEIIDRNSVLHPLFLPKTFEVSKP